ncbi:MAG TPA: LysE family translocator [Chitinophagaceae bacterium]
MDIQNFWMFALAGLMLNLTPGNDMIYVATRSTGQGIKAGIVSALGITAGCMVHILAAVVGVSAILAQSAVAFEVIKYLGAAYLVYLGIRSLLSKRSGFTIHGEKEHHSYKKIFWQGVITNVLNPKVALFFLAFLPQFIDVSAKAAHWQILFLGTWFNTSGLIVNVLVALLFGKIGGWLGNSPRFVQWQNRITGLMLIALGIKVALSSKK